MIYRTVLLVWALVPLAWAQDCRAKVQGTVTDSSQALVAGARVTLTNTATGVSATKMSDVTGRYFFDFVEPGPYTVKAEMAGFSAVVQENVQVQVRGDVTVDFVLKPSSIAEQITVTDAPVAVQFNTSTVETTIDRKMLTELPILARNPFSLALLDTSVVNRYVNERNPFYMYSSAQMDIGGPTSASGTNAGGQMNSRNIPIDSVYTMSPRTVLNLRWSFGSLQDDYDPTWTEVTKEQLVELWGGKLWDEPYTKNVPERMLPAVAISGKGNFGRGSMWFQQPHQYSWHARLSQSRGAIDSNSWARYTEQQNVNVHHYAAYIQDDWKLTRRLTVNAGLRWEYETPHGTARTGFSMPQFFGAWRFATPEDRGLYNTSAKIFSPRIGMAWRVDRKSAFRASWSRFITPVVSLTDTQRPLDIYRYTVTANALPAVEGKHEPDSAEHRGYQGALPLLAV